MKTLLIISTIFLGTSLLSNDLSWVDEQVEAIKPPRSGMNSKSLYGIKNPFVFLEKKTKKDKKSKSAVKDTTSNFAKKVVKKKPLTLSLILNSSVLINDAWYKQGDKVDGYTVKEITPKSVLLTKKKKQLLLSTRSNSKNLKFNNK